MTEAQVSAVLGVVMLGILAASIAGWANWFLQIWRGVDPLPLAPRRKAPWGFLDLLLAIGIIFIFQFMLQAIVVLTVVPKGGNPEKVAGLTTLLIAASSAASLLGLIVVLLVVAFRSGATLVDLGIDEKEILGDIGLGAQAFVMLVVPVLILQAILTMWFPSNHPLIDAVRKEPNPGLTLTAAIIAAVVGAPLLEEFGFRVLLQGWMETLVGGPHAWSKAMLGAYYEPPVITDVVLSPPSPETNPIESASAVPLPPVVLGPEANPYAAPDNVAATPVEPAAEPAPPFWPTLISAFLFAIAHWSHGPDWIPLLFLALGLGYLYRQTHRIVPTIVVHFLLNATSMTLFTLSLIYGENGPKP